MLKVGDIVKLKNPKPREKKRRWRLERYALRIIEAPLNYNAHANLNVADKIGIFRRLDTATRRVVEKELDNLVPISFWERIWKRW